AHVQETQMFGRILQSRSHAFLGKKVVVALAESHHLFEVEFLAFAFFALALEGAFGVALVAFGVALVAFGVALVAFGVALVAFAVALAFATKLGVAEHGLLIDFGDRHKLFRLAAQDDGAFKLAAVFFELVESFGLENDHVALDFAVGAWRPAARCHGKGAAIVRFDDFGVGGAALPTLRQG